MVVFARSDLSAVAISADGGGCGQVHSRPVVDGAPTKIWALACPMCELTLHGDPLWATHFDLIPRTADEERAAKKLAEEGTGTMKQVAEALALNAAKILNEHQEAEAGKAAIMAKHAAAAEAEIRAAEAERAHVEQEARLREASRVADAAVHEQPAQVADFVDVEIHPDRTCRRCKGTLTRKAGASGRWPVECLSCRET